MTIQETAEPRKVWDLFIRFFHWTLVASFLVSYLTEGEYNLHFYSGWYISILIVLRIIWGMVGSKYSRFSDFVKPPTDIIQYVKSLIANEDKAYLGHNPLGGLMLIIMLTSLSLTSITGVLLYQSEGNEIFSFLQGPILQELDEDDEHQESRYEKESHEESELGEALEELHELFANLTLLLILIHVAGVYFTSRRENRNLVKAMFTGKK